MTGRCRQLYLIRVFGVALRVLRVGRYGFPARVAHAAALCIQGDGVFSLGEACRDGHVLCVREGDHIPRFLIARPHWTFPAIELKAKVNARYVRQRNSGVALVDAVVGPLRRAVGRRIGDRMYLLVAGGIRFIPKGSLVHRDGHGRGRSVGSNPAGEVIA